LFNKFVSNFRCTAFSYLEGDPELAFFAIYDGHGGTGVANYLKDHLHEFILDQQEYQEGNMEEAIVKAFLQASAVRSMLHRVKAAKCDH
jgi:protein phosphatase 2C family protein 2/3